MAPDLSVLRNISKENLSRALRVVRGKKILILDSKLTQTLDLIANFQFLKDHGVVKVLQLETCGSPQPFENCDQVLYLIRSDLVSAKLVCDQINSNLGQGVVFSKYGVVVIPRRLHIITSLFESEGVYGHVEFGQYAYEMIPLDEHILSLQFDDVIQNLWISQETSYLATIAKSIFNIRGVYGDFHHVIAVGQYSKDIVNLMSEYELIYKNSLSSNSRPDSDIPTVIIIDRAMDFVSPLLTPLTYEAMLDEIFGIRGKTITFDADVTGKGSLKHVLTSSDPVFEKVRNLHFSKVVPQLMIESKQLKRDKEVAPTGMMSVQSLKSFVEKDIKKVQHYQKMLSLHFGALDVIIKERANDIKKQLEIEENIVENTRHKETHSFLEDVIAKGIDPTMVLRLFCLMTLAQDGMREFKSLKTQFVQSYGFKHVATLHNLERMGILYAYRGIEVNAKGVAQVFTRVANSTSLTSPTSSAPIGTKKSEVPFQTILKKLVPPANVDVDIDVPTHPSYVYNGKYTPFVARITEEILSTLTMPKSNIALIEKKLDDLMKFYHNTANVVKCKSIVGVDAYGRGQNAFVFVVGGITRSEIAALQLVGRKLGFNIICGGTDITNGRKIMNEATLA